MATFTGTSGDDSINGTSGPDDFYLGQGGSDTVTGGGGKDVFYMGGAMTADDRIDGAGGGDVLVLDGDYAVGLTFGAHTIKGIEAILLTAGGDYDLSGLTDTNFSGGRVFGGTLGASDSMRVDGSALTGGIVMLGGAGSNKLIGGSGSDVLTGGVGHDALVGNAGSDTFNLGGGIEKAKGGGDGDTFNLSAGIDLDARDKVNGGLGVDQLRMNGDHGDMVFGDHTIVGIESIFIDTQSQLHLTLADANVAAGQTLQVYMSSSGGDLWFDGSHETDGAFNITMENNGGWLIGGAGDDTMSSGWAPDTLQGGGGSDQLTGPNYYSDHFVYADVTDSTAEASDTIFNLIDADVIDLQRIDADINTAGDQGFHLVDALSGHAGELVVSYNNARHLTTVSGDVDGDGAADLVIQLDGNHGDFSNFAL